MEELIEKLNAVDTAAFEGNDTSRLQLAMAARKLFHGLETKEEKTMRLAIEEPVMFSGLQALINAGLWEAWTSVGGGEKSVDELAAITKQDVDPELLRKRSDYAASLTMRSGVPDAFHRWPSATAGCEPCCS